MTKHTPGPWTIIRFHAMADHLMGADHCRIALLDDAHHDEEIAAQNARLIAAAPDLLEACDVAAHELARHIRSGALGGTWKGVEARLRHAIAKAGGTTDE